jgi:hypothetical protein
MGVAFLGLALGILGHQVIEKQEKAFRRAEAVCKYEVMTLFDGSSHGKCDLHEDHRTATLDSPAWIGKIRQSLWEQQVGGRIHVGRFLVLFSTLLALGGVIGYREGWDAFETMYYIIITGEQCIDIWFWQQPIREWLLIAILFVSKTFCHPPGCTIGYGDLTPTTETEKFLAVFFIPLACLVTGHWLGYFANHIIESHSSRFLHRYEAQELTQDDLDAMDVNCDGMVTRAEFLEFMLLAMNKIDADLVDELQNYFHKLDTSSRGVLDREDLVEIARRKLKNPRRKLELAAYKCELLKQAAAAGPKRRRRGILSRFSWFPNLLGHPNTAGDGGGGGGGSEERQTWHHAPSGLESFLSADSSDDPESNNHNTEPSGLGSFLSVDSFDDPESNNHNTESRHSLT